MKADPLKSEGARLERAAFRNYLRRQMKGVEDYGYGEEYAAFKLCLNWVLARQKRYDKKPGGLGRK